MGRTQRYSLRALPGGTPTLIDGRIPMITLLKLLGIGLLALLALHVLGSILAPILAPLFILALLLTILAIPFAMIVGLGWFIVWAWKQIEGEPVREF